MNVKKRGGGRAAAKKEARVDNRKVRFRAGLLFASKSSGNEEVHKGDAFSSILPK